MRSRFVATAALALLAPAAVGIIRDLGAAPTGAAPAKATTTTTATTRSTTARPPKRPAATTSTTVASAEAARQRAIDTQLKTLREQVEEASEQEAAVLDALDEVAASRRSVEHDLVAIDAELATATAELDAANERLAAVTADLEGAETKYLSAEDDLSGARVELADRAITAYIHQPSAQLASVLLERQSFRELAAARDFLRSLVEAQAGAVARYQGFRTAISDERDRLAATRDEVSAQKDVVSFHRDELLRVRERQAGLRAKAAAEEARQRTLLLDVRGRVKEFEAEIAALKKESDAIGALLRARQKARAEADAKVARSAVKAPSGSGALAAPVAGAITSTFGPRRHPIFGTMRNHTGVDFSATTGTPVRAAADGTVVLATTRGGYGTTVVLDHADTLATLYGHLSRVAVAEGTSIARGTVIGYAGSTGYSTGPHLHFEVRVDGNPVDPARYL